MAIPGHREDSILRDIPGSRRVLRTFTRGRLCVTRVLLSDRVDPTLSPEIEKIVLSGEGFAPLPRSLDLTLAGYRVAARLPRDADKPWTSAVAAGVTPDGYIYVSTRWMEGTPLHHLMGQLSDRMSRQLLAGAARILVELHGRSIAYGDFKAENLVMAPDGKLALIDLDTLRLVPGPTMSVVTQDVSRSWAAPEQFQQQTFLSSDIYAFGRLVEEMFPNGLPAEFRDLVVACRQNDPLRRPQTHLVFQRISGQKVVLKDWNGQVTPPPAAPVGSPEATVRVEEEAPPSTPVPPPAPVLRTTPAGIPLPLPAAGPSVEPEEPEEPDDLALETPALEPVPIEKTDGLVNGIGAVAVSPSIEKTDEIAKPFVPNKATPSKKSGFLRGCLSMTVVGGLALVLLCAGLIGYQQQQDVAAANEQAEQTLDVLRRYKTDARINGDKEMRQAIKNKADDAYALARTPRTSGVRALATVWGQGWQDRGKNWNVADFETAEAVVNAAMDPHQPEVLLARATLNLGACRLNRKNASAAAAACLESLEALDQFFTVLPVDAAWNWMRVEGVWVEVMVLSEQYAYAGAGEKVQILGRARDRCLQARPFLDDAPVNGPELLEDCLRLDGLAADVDAWLATAKLLLEKKDDTDTRKQLFYAAGEGCEKTPTVKRMLRVDPGTKADPWCAAMGLAGQAEWDAAARMVQSVSVLQDPSAHPWALLTERLKKESPNSFYPWGW
jgi:serine/threonine protein kinase